jgi:hypothetical protein
VRKAEEEAAQKALDDYTQKAGDRAPTTPAERKALLKAIEAGPWTAPAWKAAALLGVRP